MAYLRKSIEINENALVSSSYYLTRLEGNLTQ